MSTKCTSFFEFISFFEQVLLCIPICESMSFVRLLYSVIILPNDTTEDELYMDAETVENANLWAEYIRQAIRIDRLWKDDRRISMSALLQESLTPCSSPTCESTESPSISESPSSSHTNVRPD